MKKGAPKQASLFADPSAEPEMVMLAEFDPTRRFRYALVRRWRPELGRVVFICLNPSKADENRDDNTVTRCINYAKDWGYGEYVMLNLYGYRETDSDLFIKVCKGGEDVVGPENDVWIKHYIGDPATKAVIAAWGTKSPLPERAKSVVSLVTAYRDLMCLQQTKHGHPEHPLYLKKTLVPSAYAPRVEGIGVLNDNR